MAGHGLNPNRTAHTMSNVLLGIAAGLVFGVASVAMMLPMSFPDKSVAPSAAFVDRFAIGGDHVARRHRQRPAVVAVECRQVVLQLLVQIDEIMRQRETQAQRS